MLLAIDGRGNMICWDINEIMEEDKDIKTLKPRRREVFSNAEGGHGDAVISITSRGPGKSVIIVHAPLGCYAEISFGETFNGIHS